MKPQLKSIARHPSARLLTLGAAALSSSGARGAVIYENFPDIVVQDPDTSTFDYSVGFVRFDLGLNTISADTNTSISTGLRFSFVALDQVQKKGKTFSGFANGMILGQKMELLTSPALSLGETIDGTSPHFGYNRQFDFNFANLSNAYLGIRMETAEDSGDFLYGWIQFSTGSDVNLMGPGTITLKAAAFESTPNVGIQAGAIPEPSAALLMGLAGGAAALRRRRRTSQKVA